MNINQEINGISYCGAYPWQSTPFSERLLYSNIPTIIGIVILSILIFFAVSKLKQKKHRKPTLLQQLLKFVLILLSTSAVLMILTVLAVLISTRFQVTKKAMECVITHNREDCINFAAITALPMPEEDGNVHYSQALAICNLSSNFNWNSVEICKLSVCDNLYAKSGWSKFGGEVILPEKEECKMVVLKDTYHCTDYLQNADEEWVDCGGKDCTECTPEHRKDIFFYGSSSSIAPKEFLLLYINEERDTKNFRLSEDNALKIADELISEEIRNYYFQTNQGINNYRFDILRLLAVSDQTPDYILEEIIRIHTKDGAISTNNIASSIVKDYPAASDQDAKYIQDFVQRAEKNLENRQLSN